MYVPPRFRPQSMDQVKAFVRAHPFGILVSSADRGPLATHIPLLLEGNYLYGHVSKGNPHWKAFSEEPPVLAIFNGPHAYISSSWYAGSEVPTWDYTAVHIYGSIQILEPEELHASVTRLVKHFESASEKPFELDKMDQKYVQKELRGIVGFRISTDRVEGSFKLSQNRPQDHPEIIRQLRKRGRGDDKAVADAIEQLKQKTDPS